MINKITCTLMRTFLLCAALWIGSCAKSAAPVAKTPDRFVSADEPEFVIGRLSVLDKANKDPALPVLLRQDGAEANDCFSPLETASSWQTDNPKVRNFFRENEGSLTAAAIAWLEEMFPSEKTLFSDPSAWRMTVPKPIIRHVFPPEIRLMKNQTCVDDAARDFPLGSRVVTSAFGADEMVFQSASPIPGSRIRDLKSAAAKKKLRVIAKNAYEPALDKRGNPRLGPKRQKLYHSPSGALITKKELPPPKLREVVEWKLVSPESIFFALGDLPSDSWKKEALLDVCEVYLVYNDARPQVPSCPMPKVAGFGAERSKDPGRLVVKVATTNETVVKEVPFGEVTAITANGAMVFWITAFKVEEGARLKIDSLVLDTKTKPASIRSFPPIEQAEGPSDNNKTSKKSKKK